MKGYAMLKIGESGWIEKEILYVVRWMRSAARLQSQSVLRMYTLSGKARLGSGTI